MTKRPAVKSVVRTRTGKYSPVYEGTVTKHGDDPLIFFLLVEKVDGKPKEPGSYSDPIVEHVDAIIT